jgi:hypothetical protein
MIQPVILKKFEALPESMQIEVLHYIEFLLEKHQESKQKSLDDLRQDLQSLTEEEAEKRYGYGSMAGQIIIADDFDEPLEDLAEYM